MSLPPPPLRWLDIGDTQLAYVDQGQGVPVVFVHGGGGDWRTWEPLRPLIAPRHRFVAYSRRYHHPNPSDGGGAPYTVPAQAEDLIAFVERLGAGPVHAVGGSYGGRVVLEAAVQRPALFRTVTTSEPFITPPADSQAMAAAAYNAGPKRARKWRDTKPLEGAIYAETIPLAETRDYVKKVMLNTVYYAAVLSGETRSLKERLGTIAPRRASAEVVAAEDRPDV